MHQARCAASKQKIERPMLVINRSNKQYRFPSKPEVNKFDSVNGPLRAVQIEETATSVMRNAISCNDI